MIPKKIHYVWLGGEKPPFIENCIASWRKNCPDYEIIEWNDCNFDVNSNDYCHQAYENKKWAFASDYIRLSVLYKYGGIYLDTDIEVVRSFDEFLHLKAFATIAKWVSFMEVQNGFIAAESGNEWVKNILDYYEKVTFVNTNGKLEIDATGPLILTSITKKLYPTFKLEDIEQHFEHLSIYPDEYFTASDYRQGLKALTDKTYCIHRFQASWLQKSLRRKIVEFLLKIKFPFMKVLVKKRVKRIHGAVEKKILAVLS
jgi:mannosyltransferase OCH1-like enzyme